jgi:GNAT superfamily N-acetyltransferase
MTQTIDIRIATPNDAAFLADFGARVFYDSYAAENDPADMAAYLAKSFSAQKQMEELLQPGSIFFIAMDGAEPVGYTRMQTGSAPTCITGLRPIELVRMYSAKEMIGKGVGGKLMQACIAHAGAGGHDCIWLSVWQLNPRAIAFYRKWGFDVAGTATFTIGSDVQSDWIMARPVQQGT